jgi:large exoprotein involved in heme utilization and adhesion
VLQGYENYATGRGGDVQIHARDLVLRDAGEITTASSSTGDGGDIVLDVTHISLENGASISAESSNTGNAGSVRLIAGDSVKLLKDSSITTEADFSGGGRINIDASELLYLLESRITSAVADGSGNGGDIIIDPVFVVLNDSQILANAFAGAGGNIDITANFFFASPDSILDASSRLGTNGRIVIQSDVIQNNPSLSNLPANFLDASALLRQPCAASARTTASSFVVSGRGGLPPSPEDPLASTSIITFRPEPDGASSTAVDAQMARQVWLPVTLAGHPALVSGCTP